MKKDRNAKVKALCKLQILNNEFECGAIMLDTQSAAALRVYLALRQ